LSDPSEFRSYAAQCIGAAKQAMDERSRAFVVRDGATVAPVAEKAEAAPSGQQQQQIQPHEDKDKA